VSTRTVDVALSRTQRLVLAVPAETPELPPELLGAIAFLGQGLEGASPNDLARVSVKLVAHELAPGAEAHVSVWASERCVASACASAAQPFVEEAAAFGRVDIVDEVADFGVYRLRIAPAHAIPTHEHHTMDEWEYALQGDLALQGERFALGEAVRWPLGHPHRWENLGTSEAVVLCIDRPRFDASDEILVESLTLEKCPLRFRPHVNPPSPRTCANASS
jgi:mannose-6-phosphate isomerase-like protein (cupin superfamily)